VNAVQKVINSGFDSDVCFDIGMPSNVVSTSNLVPFSLKPKEENKDISYKTDNQETEVMVFIAKHELQDYYDIAKESILNFYPSDSTLNLRVLCDEENKPWLLIQIKCNLEYDELSKAYKNWVKIWLRSTIWPKAGLIAIEHI